MTLTGAISEYIIKKVGCITLFATHFHELTALEQCHPCAKNCHVTAIKPSGSSNLTFLYEVRFIMVIIKTDIPNGLIFIP